jgi:hypothetical protein
MDQMSPRTALKGYQVSPVRPGNRVPRENAGDTSKLGLNVLARRGAFRFHEWAHAAAPAAGQGHHSLWLRSSSPPRGAPGAADPFVPPAVHARANTIASFFHSRQRKAPREAGPIEGKTKCLRGESRLGSTVRNLRRRSCHQASRPALWAPARSPSRSPPVRPQLADRQPPRSPTA